MAKHSSSSSRPKAAEASSISSRIEMVGRDREIERLLSYLRARKARRFVYYWARGGLGKTRLLEELLDKVQAEGPGYYATGIIDLYHTDTHSNSDVERAIMDGLDAEGRWFLEYRRERKLYLKLRELGADSERLEERRARLSDRFVAEFNQMADEAHKLILLFDTVELLQYESSLVEEQAGLDTVDTRLKPWLLSVLPQLRNVLVVFAGRPKPPAPGEQTDPQARLEADLTRVFGDELSIVELQPLTCQETADFIHRLPGGDVVLPEKYLAVAHKLTGGRPIFIHLLADLLRSLAEDPQAIYGLLDGCQRLVDVVEGDPALEAERSTFNRTILESVFNNAREFGDYLGLVALMPKGVDRGILVESLGLRPDEADALLARLQPLAFAKEYKQPGGQELRSYESSATTKPHLYRLFLHDEMYALLTTPAVMQNLRANERRIARALVSRYYTPLIEQLEVRLAQPLTPEARIPLREALHKLQVERLYYLLAQDPRTGYQEYRTLSDRANRERHVGFAMRLLDEFLRFYNNPDRRKQFGDAGIAHERVIRENALLWLERFHWWARYRRASEFAERILANPGVFHIGPDDLAIMGNVVALWARAHGILSSYNPVIVELATRTLTQVREAAAHGQDVGLAWARLATSIGYHLDLGGKMAEADRYYEEAQAAFRALNCCWDELAMLLNNQAWLYASQGEMILARPLAREALALNEAHGQRYSTGLTLATLATIENIDGNWREAEQHAEEAREIFDELDDAHGLALSLLAVAQAKRKRAKYEIQKKRKRQEARQILEEARTHLEGAVVLAKGADLHGDIPQLLSKLGKVYRELGRLTVDLGDPQGGGVFYRKSEETFQQALNLPPNLPGLSALERAGMVVDYAEMLFIWGNADAAEEVLSQFEMEWTAMHQQPTLEGNYDVERVTTQFRRPLGKYERLRGQMALAARHEIEALVHFNRAYDCFERFSPTARDRETMVELVYDELLPVLATRRQELIEALRGMTDSGFTRSLSRLLGVRGAPQPDK
jgi:tetratricopeptide (TPR) repeat protein